MYPQRKQYYSDNRYKSYESYQKSDKSYQNNHNSGYRYSKRTFEPQLAQSRGYYDSDYYSDYSYSNKNYNSGYRYSNNHYSSDYENKYYNRPNYRAFEPQIAASNRYETYSSYDGDQNSQNSYHSYGSYSGGDCCPLVVDPKALLALKLFIAAAVYLLNTVITMSMLMAGGKRRKRYAQNDIGYILDVIHTSKLDLCKV